MSKTRFSGVLKNAEDIAAEPELSPPTLRESHVPVRRVGRPPGKKTDPAYRQVTVYLQEDVHRQARKLLVDDRRQFSDLVNELVGQWVRSRS